VSEEGREMYDAVGAGFIMLIFLCRCDDGTCNNIFHFINIFMLTCAVSTFVSDVKT
jgi:hypothetical protein